MPGTPWRARLAALGATTAIVVAACGGAATPTPAPATAAPTAAPHRGAVRGASVLPRPRPRSTAPRETFNGQPYTGNAQVDQGARREDRRVHPLRPGRRPSCSKVAFSPFAINDTAYLEKARRRRLDRRATPNGTGPYKLKEWARATTSSSRPTRPTGARRPRSPTVVFRWSTEAAQRLVELQSGTVDGIDNPGPTTSTTIQGDPNLQALPARGPERLLPRHEQHVSRRSTTRRSARRSPWASTGSGSSTTSYPPGSEVATHFTPCAIPYGCVRRRLVRLRRGGRQGAPRRGRLPRRLQDHDPPTATSSAATCPSRSSWPRTSRPSSRPTWTSRHDRRPGVRHLPRQRQRRQARRHPPARLGRRLPGRHQLPRLPLRRRRQRAVRRPASPTSWRPLQEGAHERRRRGPRAGLRRRPTTLIRQHVPMVPIAHGGSGTACKADVEGAHALAARQRAVRRR